MCSLRAARIIRSHMPPSHITPSVLWFSQQFVCPRRQEVALLTVDVRLDGAAIDRIHVAHPFPDGQHFNAQFVSGMRG